MADLDALPSVDGFALIKFKVECPSVVIFEFAGMKEEARSSGLKVWVFAFFDASIDKIDVAYGETFPPARSIALRRIDVGEWKFAADVILEEGSISLKCREFFSFGRTATEYSGN